jgi:hypothetical protein
MQLTWQRVPDLPTLTPSQRRIVGFWKQVGSERRTFEGKLLSSNSVRSGFLIFTASGYVAAHLMDPNRRKYAAEQPTPEEALEALKTYGPSAYFGPFTLREDERLEVLLQIGSINPGLVGTEERRHYEFVGDNRLILKPPPVTESGQKVQAVAIWERVSKGIR